MRAKGEPAWLAFYRSRLLRREMRLLAAYRTQGRRPRIRQGAYWRASFIPLVLGLVFFGARWLYMAMGVEMAPAQNAAALAAALLLMGLLMADMQLFIANSPAWAFTKQVVNWPAVAGRLNQLSPQADGSPWDLRQPGQAGSPTPWDRVQVPPSFLRAAARSYQHMAKTPPSLGQTLTQGGEAQGLIFVMLGLSAVVQFFPQVMTAALPMILFFAAFPAKRLKARLDFWVTWPELRQVFDWQAIERFAARG